MPGTLSNVPVAWFDCHKVSGVVGNGPPLSRFDALSRTSVGDISGVMVDITSGVMYCVIRGQEQCGVVTNISELSWAMT